MYWLSELKVSSRNVDGYSGQSRKDMMERSFLACFACRQRPQRQAHKPSHNSSSALERYRWTGKGETGTAVLQREAFGLIDWRHQIAESGWDFLLPMRRRPSQAALSNLLHMSISRDLRRPQGSDRLLKSRSLHSYPNR